jgi:hypothetical protein
MNFSRNDDATLSLGISPSALAQYEQGFRRGSHEPLEVPRAIGLACSALIFGLPHYEELHTVPKSPGAVDLVAYHLRGLELAMKSGTVHEKIAAARTFTSIADFAAGRAQPSAGRPQPSTQGRTRP